jgi:aspartate racemase
MEASGRAHSRGTPRFLTIGILGGMGPEATGYFYNILVKNTAAVKDQLHPPVIVCSLPQIPHRTDAILRGGPSPLPLLLQGADILARAGADFGVMPCITAHHFFPGLASGSPIPFVSLVEETVRQVQAMRPRPHAIGLVATTGTIAARLFHEPFERVGVAVLTPSPAGQAKVMAAIYGPAGIKAGKASGAPRAAVLAAARELVHRGAQAIIAGCTEIPLALRPGDLLVPLVDPMLATARVCISRAGAAVRQKGGQRPGAPRLSFGDRGKGE